jgi:hypothetical protein
MTMHGSPAGYIRRNALHLFLGRETDDDVGGFIEHTHDQK